MESLKQGTIQEPELVLDPLKPESVREYIRFDIAHPNYHRWYTNPALKFLYASEAPENLVSRWIDNPTLERLQQVFAILREEFQKARASGISFHRDGTVEDMFEREATHVQIAQSRGVDIASCRLGLAVVGGTEKRHGLYVQFKMPKFVDPLSACIVVLAPSQPSEDDISAAMKYAANLSEEEKTWLQEQYGHKLGGYDIRNVVRGKSNSRS